MPRSVLVTGANRGIGLEVARQLAARGDLVLLAARDPAKGERAARELAREGLKVQAVSLDVADEASVAAAAARIAEEHRRLDVLVNNAAVLYDTWQRGLDADLAAVHEALEVNLLGAWRCTQALRGPLSVLWAVELPDDGPTGGFFRDGRPLPW